jgi:uncharacterized protein YutE (UPF0331/DUF86 family)
MGDPERISHRLLALHETLAHLARPEAADAEHLTRDPVMAAAVERWLQVAVEACIDVAFHVSANAGWTPPPSARAAFAQLAAHGRIPTDLAERLGRATAMRNVLVHDYTSVDLALVAAAVREDLGDLREFAALAATWIAAA